MWEKKIHYEKLEIADYLMPYNSKLSIEDKRKLFSIRNRMTEIGNQESIAQSQLVNSSWEHKSKVCIIVITNLTLELYGLWAQKYRVCMSHYILSTNDAAETNVRLM